MAFVNFRLRDITNENDPPRQHYKKDNVEAVRSRQAARTPRNPSASIYYTCETQDGIDTLKRLMDQVKTFLGQGNPNMCNNKQLLDEVLRFYIAKNIDREDGGGIVRVDKPTHCVDNTFVPCLDTPSCNEQLFICAQSSVENLVQRVELHNKCCEHSLAQSEFQMSGHVGVATFTCARKHQLRWHSSPYLGIKYLVNEKMAHGYFISGILPNQYVRIVDAAGIGKLGQGYLDTFFTTYSECVKTVVKESTDDTLLEEIVQYDNMDGINILTDARHGTRKNSKYSDVVCIGAKTHKVLRVETVTRAEEKCAQKHELIGTERIYKYLEAQEGGTVHVRVHCHDRNSSVNSWLAANRQETVSTNDTWHATKNVAKEMRSVCSGPMYAEGKTWHHQLADKAASIKTHFYFCMKNCQENALTLRSMILNIIEHYKNNHTSCAPDSRCKTDTNYEPSKITITDSTAESLLRQALMKTTIYKSPYDYVHCMDTYYVESFNNSMLQYHDKRLASHCGEKSYKFRTHLAILDWNDHINSRRVTSTKLVTDARKPRRQSLVKVMERKRFRFWARVWGEYTAISLQ